MGAAFYFGERFTERRKLQDDALPDHDPIKVESRVKPFVCDLFPKSGSHFRDHALVRIGCSRSVELLGAQGSSNNARDLSVCAHLRLACGCVHAQ
jgi:hypothetical protein